MTYSARYSARNLLLLPTLGLRRVMNIFTIIHCNEASIKIYDGEFDTETN